MIENYISEIIYLGTLIFGGGIFYNKVSNMQKEIKEFKLETKTSIGDLRGEIKDIRTEIQDVRSEVHQQNAQLSMLQNNLDHLAKKQAEDSLRLEKRQDKLETILFNLRDEFYRFSHLPQFMTEYQRDKAD